MTHVFEALAAPFTPPLWLKNAHVQTMLASLPPRRRRLERQAQAWLPHARLDVLNLPDGVRLLSEWDEPLAQSPVASAERAPLAILLHGWEGSARSVHMLSLAGVLLRAGIATVRLNLRDHGATHHLNAGLFHSCRLDEVVQAVRAIREREPHRPVVLVGFSLGGNFALRLAASADLDLAAVLAVCPPLDPAHSLIRLQQGAMVYRHYFLQKWNRSLTLKRQCWPQTYTVENCPNGDDLLQMTDVLVRRFTDYPSVEQYFQGYALTGARLQTLTTRAAIVLAADDPIIPVGDRVGLASTPQLRIIEHPLGGHCGFLMDLNGAAWIDHRIARAIESVLQAP